MQSHPAELRAGSTTILAAAQCDVHCPKRDLNYCSRVMFLWSKSPLPPSHHGWISQQFLNCFYINPGPTTSSKTVLFLQKQMLPFLYCEQCPLHRSSLLPSLLTFLSCNTRAGKPVICQSLEPGLRTVLLNMYHVGRAFNWFPSNVERRTIERRSSNVERRTIERRSIVLPGSDPFVFGVPWGSRGQKCSSDHLQAEKIKNGWN